MKPAIISVLFFLSASIQSFAQEKTDSLIKKHSPRKATLLSTVLPGAGQYYNKKYWKIPVIYAGFAGMAYLVHFNNTRYQDYKEAYVIRVDEDPSTTDQYVDQYSNEDLVTLKNYYRRNRDLSYIIAGLIYVLNIIDASVDAHLIYFDVSDNLSLNIQPSVIMNDQNKPASGVSLTLLF